MSYVPGLLVALAAFWFLLSGQTAPLFVALGVLSVLLSLALAERLKIIGRDASPYHRIVQLIVYFAYLLVEIAKANLAVIKRILGPSHAIDPVMVVLKTSARTDLGRALFANSITLTPGTVTVDVEEIRPAKQEADQRDEQHSLRAEGVGGKDAVVVRRPCDGPDDHERHGY